MDKETFLRKLETNNIKKDIIILLRNASLPLVMWGCGQVAEDVSIYLSSNGIKIDAVLLDEKYFSAQTPSEFRGIPIMNRRQIANKYDNFNLIIGHEHYESGNDIKKQMQQINEVFYIPSLNYGQYKNVSAKCVIDEADRYVNLCNNLKDQLSVSNLSAYLNTKITGDVNYIIDAFKEPMTFFDNDVFKVSDEEVYMDIGAYDGDTIKLFLATSQNKYKKIIAIEPDEANYNNLEKFIKENSYKNVELSKIGAWNKKEDLKFYTGSGQISSVSIDKINHTDSDDKVIIHADCMDNIFGQEKVSIIKINYFDGVLEALQGCRQIIVNNHPKLVVTVGFDIYNILKVSEYIMGLNQNYNMFLRFNSAMTSRFVLYAY